MNHSPTDILKQYWHYDAFRPQQADIIQSVLDGKDTLALLPTGGGKSLCYQVPALMKDGLCLVISPLIALMKDQVENLEKRGIAALAVHSGLSTIEVRKTLQLAMHGDHQFLYLSPERLETALFKDYLPALNINLIAVDEAHCISQWGYDFRPSYLRIATLRDELPGVPILALTASATPEVQDDIVLQLKFKTNNIFRQSFERSNLSYSVFLTDSKINKASEVLKKVNGSSIIYCRNRKLTREIAHLLRLQNIAADYYHAGLSQDERNAKQDAWVNNKNRVMVCTNAFGMGIDKPDVRTVIHYDIPDCIENYYQEAGRAGRDHQKAYAVLLYQQDDLQALQALPELRFPSITEIRKIYQSLADYLQIPVGIGEGSYYDFDLNEFAKNFKHDILLVMNVLKVLEQEGHIHFNENIFIPSQAHFLIPKDALIDYEESHPQLEPVMKCMLRNYEGIMENAVSVYEKQIAWLTRKHVDDVKVDLSRLKSLGIIDYMPQKETPQIYFILNRAPAQFLNLNHEQYLQRKKKFSERVNSMGHYVQMQQECRSKFIASYFGDNALHDCGVCDNCLNRKRNTDEAAQLNKAMEAIFSHIPQRGIETNLLIEKMQGFNRELTWKAIKFLQSENKIHIDELNFITATN